MAELKRAPALDVASFVVPGLTLSPATPAGQAILRGDGAAIAGALRAIVGVEPPFTPCTRSGADDVVAWLAPDRWLVCRDHGDGAALARTLAERLVRGVADVHDVTDGLAVVDVAGRSAAMPLAALCGLDPHPRAFAADHCARTLVAGVDTIVYRRGDGFRLHVARPLGLHLWDSLVAAANDLED